MSPVIWSMKISPCLLGVNNTGLLESKQSEIPYYEAAIEQYYKLYTLVAG